MRLQLKLQPARGRAWLWQAHQWLGLATCVALLLWGLTGVLHPLMSRLQPQPARRQAPALSVSLSGARPVAQVLAQHGLPQVQSLSVVRIAGEPAYRVTLPGSAWPRYFALNDGHELANAEPRYAVQLAQHYTGLEHAPALQAQWVNAFDDDYPAVNRLLPVWRVQLAARPELRVYVDTSHARLATLSDPWRQRWTYLFRWGHNWAFLAALPPLWRQGLMLVALAAVAFSALSGLYFFWAFRPSAARRLADRPWARLHRWGGVLLTVPVLLSCGSGAYHLLRAAPPASPALDAPYASASLQGPAGVWPLAPAVGGHQAGVNQAGVHPPRVEPPRVEPAWAALHLVRWQGQPAWLALPVGAGTRPPAQVGVLAQSAAAPHLHGAAHTAAPALAGAHAQHEPQRTAPPAPQYRLYRMAGEAIGAGQPFDPGLALAQARVRAALAVPAAAPLPSRWVTQFGGEYGFIFKRLPVVQVTVPERDERWYVDPVDGALAARVRAADAQEGWVFANLHKWSFFGPAKDLRDALLALVALAHVLLALLGLALFWRLRQRRRSYDGKRL